MDICVLMKCLEELLDAIQYVCPEIKFISCPLILLGLLAELQHLLEKKERKKENKEKITRIKYIAFSSE